jgi:hypothetical protein
VLRIRDVYPGFRIQGQKDSGALIRNKTQKIVSKPSKILSWIFIPDPDLVFLPISDPGSRGQKDTRSRIRNTEINTGNYQYLASKTYYTGYTKAGTEFLVRLSE